MAMKEFRTYKRRNVTRRSGYHVSGQRTGGECIVLNSAQYTTKEEKTIFTFIKDKDTFVDLFERTSGLLAFGGYINPNSSAQIKCRLSYLHGETTSNIDIPIVKLEANKFNSFGFHKEFALNSDEDFIISEITVEMTIEANKGTKIEFIGFEMGTIKTEYYQSVGEDASKEARKEINEFWDFFNQKTSLSIPHIYYFDTTLPFETYLIDDGKMIDEGVPVILKGCNRCSRYIPINIEDEPFTAGFALHCKKRAPCNHSTFSRYVIDNYSELSTKTIAYLQAKGFMQVYNGQNIIKSYYGHQLECKPCKKYFVNAKLNPMRDSQQHREDSLRRRALEVLVDNLLDKQLVHFEFRQKNKKEFTEYIWNKFNKRCFKCQTKISLGEMHLDHTMPLAYLYRLDETATCLCAEHNSQKSDHFPVEYYTIDELKRLSKITGLSLEVLMSTSANQEVVKLLKDNIVWFFDEFLMEEDYQKVRKGKLTADKIYAAIIRVLDKKTDLIEEYHIKTGKYPKSISIGSNY